MAPIYVFGDVFADLTGAISAALTDGQRVLWVSFSGTVQFLSREDGLLVRLRQSATHPLPGDRWSLLVEAPWGATTCGMWDASGYRSTPPAWVGAVVTGDDVTAALDEARDVARAVTQAQFDAVTVGHPEAPCGARYCRWRAAHAR